jgi:hypothetical protein
MAEIFYAGSLSGWLGVALLLGDRVLQRIAFLLHLVSAISSGSAGNYVPATRKHWNHGQQHSHADYSFYFHSNS